jgi:predicted pyridoxine 5'-phosphate oxidase superfamily flavin-nucleotide-binding protein
MTGVFHEGERQVQRRAGVEEAAAHVAQMIRATMPPAAQAFLKGQAMAVAGSASRDGRVWASLLTGEPGFLRAADERTVLIAGGILEADPLWENLKGGAELGLLAIDFAGRRRMRVNGPAERLPSGQVLLHVREAFSNCPKYIQRRERIASPRDGLPPQTVEARPTLTEAHQRWVRQADTFFIASTHATRGADASHRGGSPGFVRVVAPDKLGWPDYAGNGMFQTLGNVAVNAHAGLLFLDGDTGGTLQVTGRARVVWDRERVAEVPGAERLVAFEVEQVRETAHATPLRWRLVDAWPYNPPAEACRL